MKAFWPLNKPQLTIFVFFCAGLLSPCSSSAANQGENGVGNPKPAEEDIAYENTSGAEPKRRKTKSKRCKSRECGNLPEAKIRLALDLLGLDSNGNNDRKWVGPKVSELEGKASEIRKYYSEASVLARCIPSGASRLSRDTSDKAKSLSAYHSTILKKSRNDGLRAVGPSSVYYTSLKKEYSDLTHFEKRFSTRIGKLSKSEKSEMDQCLSGSREWFKLIKTNYKLERSASKIFYLEEKIKNGKPRKKLTRKLEILEKKYRLYSENIAKMKSEIASSGISAETVVCIGCN